MSRPPSDLDGAAAAIARVGGALGAPLYVIGETASTNDLAKQAAKEGAPHGATWVTEVQHQGRGRQGRTWIATPGESLLFSVLVRVACPAARLPQLSLVAGLAARDAIAKAAPSADVKVKWPNDVVIGEIGQKVCGVLVETTMIGTTIDALVIGVGINVHTRAFPPDIAARATSIALWAAEATEVPNRAEILANSLFALDRDISLVAARGLAPVHARLSAADSLRGARVRCELGAGIAEGVDTDGRLLVRGDDGVLARWSSGEVHLERPG